MNAVGVILGGGEGSRLQPLTRDRAKPAVPIAGDRLNQDIISHIRDTFQVLIGEKTAEELLNPGPDGPYRMETVGYGLANWLIVQGDTTEAIQLLERLVEDPWWPGFGRISAEAELFRLTRGPGGPAG